MESLKMESSDTKIRQVLVKLLDGKHRFLNFYESAISAADLKRRIQNLTSIAATDQVLLINNSRVLHSDQILNLDPKPDNNGTYCDSLLVREENYVRFRFPVAEGVPNFPIVVNLLLRLRGGKGGFGSLLRGAATKAGQKKTHNFDACRDMSGRRLRHVNAEKKLEEWKAGAEERQLEKMAEDFLRKKTKEAAKSGKSNGADSAEKYVAKYREDSEICVEKVEKAIQQSVKGLANLKRKDQVEEKGSASKRLKIWFGKRKVDDSDSEDLDEDDVEQEEEDEKSDVIDNGSHSDSSKETDGSSGSVTGGKIDDGSHDQVSAISGSAEEIVADKATESSRKDGAIDMACVDIATGDHEIQEHSEVVPEMAQESQHHAVNDSTSEKCEIPCSTEVGSSVITHEAVSEESFHVTQKAQDQPKPLNLNEYNSAAELEALGLEQLKVELMSHGLKCGGTVQERAARLFLLKTTPLEKLPKKLFAKK